jgi:hypothetical protein
MGAKIHIAGFPVRVGNEIRQLCAWCGERIVDLDLSAVMYAPGCETQDERSHFFECNALVALDGPATYVVPHEDGANLPPNCCAGKPVVRLVSP